MKKYKTIRNGLLALITISMFFCSLFPTVLADTSGTADFQETTADIGDTIHAEFHWYDAVWSFSGEYYCDMSIKDPGGHNHDYYVEEDDEDGTNFLSCVTDEIGIWEAELKVWDGSDWLTYSDTIYVGSSGTASGSASFQESSADTGDTIHADFSWSHAHYHLTGEYYAAMYIYKPDDSTASSYIEEVSASSSKTLSYTTDASGTWEAELKVWDGSDFLTYSDTVYVSGGGGNEDPVACFIADDVGLDVDFDASCSSDSDGTITTWWWDWTDDDSWDDTSSGEETSYTYPASGPYTCRLRIFDNDGAWDEDIESFTLSGGGSNEDPVASFTYSTSSLTVNVDGSGSSDSDGTITGYQWDWTTDESYDDTGVTQSHTYSANGTYNVTLRVMDNGSATNTTMKQITVTVGGGSGSGFTTDNTVTYLIIAVAAIAIGAVIYFGPTAKKGGRKKK